MTVTAEALTIAQAFQATAHAHADKPAIRAHHGGIERSLDDYHQRVCTCGAAPHQLNACAAGEAPGSDPARLRRANDHAADLSFDSLRRALSCATPSRPCDG